MKLKELKCISENVNLEDYYYLYNLVRKNMEIPEWLGYIPQDEIIEILENKGKIWLYYLEDIPVCSMLYIPVKNKTLLKHNIEYDETITGSLGPIMVNPNYIGNGLMMQMLNVLDKYNMDIGNKYIFSKAVKDNIYSVRCLEKNGYKVTHEYSNERGINIAMLKEL